MRFVLAPLAFIASGLIAAGPTPQGTAVVVLDVIPDSAVDFHFDGLMTQFVLDDDTDPTLPSSMTFSAAPGSHSVQPRTFPGNMDLTDITCLDPTGDSLGSAEFAAVIYEVAAGETVTCTFTYVTRGGLDIVKDARPDTSKGFFFSATHHSGIWLFGRPSLNPSSLPNLNMVPGTYTVTERPTPGWPLTAIECNDPDAGTVVDLAAGTAVVDIDPGEIITCTFINEKRPETVALHDPATGRWSLLDSMGAVHTITYGDPSDQPIMGDWDCDGTDTPGLYRPVHIVGAPAGKVYLRNANTTGNADVEYFFGNPGDIAIPGDWNGDGCDTVALFRPGPGAAGTMFVTNRLGSYGRGIGAAEISFPIDGIGSPPFGGDFDGDERDELGYYASGPAGPQAHLFDGLGGGVPDLVFAFGDPGDVGLVGDWNGDGVDSLAVLRPGSSAFFLRYTNTTGGADVSVPSFGSGSWSPLHGQFGLG